MSARGRSCVTVSTGPDVQLIGGSGALIQGAAALDAYRVMVEGIARVRQRDCIEPSPRLMETVAALKAAADAARTSSASSEIAELRRRAPSAPLRSGEVIGIEEVARMCNVGQRQARHLAPSLGGWRTAGRGRPWRFDLGLVQAYIDAEGTR